MPRKWYESIVTEIKQIGDATRQFTLKVDGLEHFDFLPGQFITMDLPLGEKRLDRWRSYSIASSSGDDGTIELCIVKLPEGRATTYLFDEITVGSTIIFKGPDGQFVLPDAIEQDVVLICTGTGVAPFRSMINALFSTNKSHRKLHLIFGTRFLKDVLYMKEFEQLMEDYPSFEYSITLSREQAWSGNSGYVHEIYKRDYAIVRDDVCFYLCGWSQMVDEAAKNLKDMGYAPNQIKVELYG